MSLTGIKLISGFALESGQPLDARITVSTEADRDALSTDGIAYPGMIVYVEEKSSHYTYDGASWKIFSGDQNVNSVSKNIVGTSATATSNGSVTGSGGVYLNHLEDNTVTSTHKIVGSGATSVTSANGNITISSADTKVTAVGNHYAPSADTSAALSVDASSTTAATWGTTSLVTGVNLQRDAKGHVTGVTVDSIRMPANPDTDTDNNQKVKVGATTFGANDVVNFIAGTGISIVADNSTGNDSITISSDVTDSDRKTSSGDTDSKIFLVGATAQNTSGQTTYSHAEVFVDTSHYVNASGFNASSDKRLKENIKEYKPQKTILNLPVVEFDFIESKAHQIGCLAQDLQEICPEIVTEGDDGYLRIQESKIVYLLLNEVKKLRQEIDELKNK